MPYVNIFRLGYCIPLALAGSIYVACKLATHRVFVKSVKAEGMGMKRLSAYNISQMSYKK